MIWTIPTLLPVDRWNVGPKNRCNGIHETRPRDLSDKKSELGAQRETRPLYSDTAEYVLILSLVYRSWS